MFTTVNGNNSSEREQHITSTSTTVALTAHRTRLESRSICEQHKIRRDRNRQERRFSVRVTITEGSNAIYATAARILNNEGLRRVSKKSDAIVTPDPDANVLTDQPGEPAYISSAPVLISRYAG